MIEFFLLGLVLGFLGVGIPTMRTIKAMEGHVVPVFFLSLVASCNMYVFMYLSVALNYPFMVGNAIGAACSVSLIAYKRRKKNGGE